MQVTIENYKSAASIRALRDLNQAIADSRETERKMIVMSEIYFALMAIELPNMPELSDYDARYGFTVKVEDQEMWGKIHKITGPLMCVGKEAIGDGRSNKVMVTMSPERSDLRYNLKFKFEKKLDKNDKCKVVSKKVKETTVVCNI